MSVREVSPSAEGAFALRGGHIYALLVIVNGPTTCEDLEAALVRDRFIEPIGSAPDEWKESPAKGWPKEPDLAIAANECLVRVSAILSGKSSQAFRFDRDRPIEPGATYTIAAAWDFGEPPPEKRVTTGAEPPPSAGDKGGNSTGLIVGAVVAAGVGVWAMHRSAKRAERDESRLARITAREERGEVLERVDRYLREGVDPHEAEDLAERDMELQEVRRLASELEHR